VALFIFWFRYLGNLFPAFTISCEPATGPGWPAMLHR